MRNPGGTAILTDADGREHVTDTFSCGHCSRIVMVKPKQDPADLGGLCKRCVKLICPQCAGFGDCDPIEEKLKRWEASYLARRSYGII